MREQVEVTQTRYLVDPRDASAEMSINAVLASDAIGFDGLAGR